MEGGEGGNVCVHNTSQFGGACCDKVWDQTTVNKDSDLDLVGRDWPFFGNLQLLQMPQAHSAISCSGVSTVPALLHLHGATLQDKFLFSEPFLCQLFLPLAPSCLTFQDKVMVV